MIPNDILIKCVLPKLDFSEYNKLFLKSLDIKDNNFINNFIIPSFVFVENKLTKIVVLDKIIEYVITNYTLQEIIDYFYRIDLPNNLSFCTISKLWDVIIKNKYIELLYGFAGNCDACWVQIFYNIIDLHEYKLLKHLITNDVHFPLFQHLLHAISIQETNVINIMLLELENTYSYFYDKMRFDVHYYITNIEYQEDEIFDTENIVEYDYLLHLSYLVSRNDRYAKRMKYQFRRLQKLVGINNINRTIRYYLNYFDET